MKAKKHNFEKRTLVSPADGLEISVLICRPVGKDIMSDGSCAEHEGTDRGKVHCPTGIVQLVHGMCEHKERYIPFMEFLADNGYASIIHDHRGHGESVKSSDDLGYFYEGGYMAMIEDVKAVTLLAREEFSGNGNGANKESGENMAGGKPERKDAGKLPLILFGHSMGSMAVRSFAKRYDCLIDGLVVCGSPSYNPGLKIGKALARGYILIMGDRHRPSLIQSIAFGAFNRKFRDEKSSNAWICSDPEIVSAYDADPHCNFQFTTDGFINLFSLMEDAYGIKGWRKANPDLPIVFVSGEDDPCRINDRRFSMAVERMREAGYRDVQAMTYPRMRHEILNETGREKVWNDILAFCDRIEKQEGNN